MAEPEKYVVSDAEFLLHGGPYNIIAEGEIQGAAHLNFNYGANTLAGSVINVPRGCRLELNPTVILAGGVLIRMNRVPRHGIETPVLRIGSNTLVNFDSRIVCEASIDIGDDCLFSFGVTIRDNDSHQIKGMADFAPVRIGNRVWIGQNVIVLKGVTIGDGAVIAAGAVVTRDVPPRCLAAGNPARILRHDVEWEP